MVLDIQKLAVTAHCASWARLTLLCVEVPNEASSTHTRYCRRGSSASP